MKKNKKQFKILSLYFAPFIILSLVATMFFLFQKSTKGNNINYADYSKVAYIQIKKENNPWDWWNQEYSYYRQIQIKNNNLIKKTDKNNWVQFQINHEKLVQEKKAKENGADLQIYFQNKKNFKQLPIITENLNTKHTIIKFPLLEDVEAKKTADNYYLYYGNFIAEKQKPLPFDKENINIIKKINIELKPENMPSIFGQTNRKWMITKFDKNPEFQKLIYTLNLSINNLPRLDSNIPKFKIISNKTEIQGNMKKQEQGKYIAEIDTSKLNPGLYQIQASYKTNQETLLSQRSGFVVSKPLFVVLSLDWEGYNASDYQLKNLEKFSSQYDNINFTHFFNPRIYITKDVSSERANYLTQWMKKHEANGDEVGMHLHMHHDVLQKAGVEPKYGQGTKMFWLGYSHNGYDTPASLYNYEETKKILQWGKNKLKEQGFKNLKSFRFGLWYANMENLKAVNDTGFLIDSSGRDKFTINGFTSEWNLGTTTRPYQLAIEDQNQTNTKNIKNKLNLWEFPKNGISPIVDPNDLFKNTFTDNFKALPLQKLQVLTYLSHPQAFAQDYSKLESKFNQANRYQAKYDNGPVIFSTLEKTYDYVVGK